jgi:hypothetical protein
VTFKSFGIITVFLLSSCAAANAGKVNMTSDYGALFTITSLGTVDGFSGESFIDSNNLTMFDFELTLPGTYTVELTAIGATITDNYGLLTCPSPALTPPAPQCSNDLPPGVNSSSDYGSLNGASTIATFPVTGAVAGDDTFVFFAELDSNTVGSVSASIQSAVPEPRLLPLVGFGLLAAFVLFRRWRVAN